jgi:hypothetical protein
LQNKFRSVAQTGNDVKLPTDNFNSQPKQTTPQRDNHNADSAAASSQTSAHNTSSNVFTRDEIKQIKANVSKYQCVAEFNDDGTAKSVRGPNPIKAVINSGNPKFKQGAFTLNFDININWNDQKAVENLEKKINVQLAESTEGGVPITKITINGKPDSQINELFDKSKANATHPNAIHRIMLSPSPSPNNTPTPPNNKKRGIS